MILRSIGEYSDWLAKQTGFDRERLMVESYEPGRVTVKLQEGTYSEPELLSLAMVEPVRFSVQQFVVR